MVKKIVFNLDIGVGFSDIDVEQKNKNWKGIETF